MVTRTSATVGVVGAPSCTLCVEPCRQGLRISLLGFGCWRPFCRKHGVAYLTLCGGFTLICFFQRLAPQVWRSVNFCCCCSAPAPAAGLNQPRGWDRASMRRQSPPWPGEVRLVAPQRRTCENAQSLYGDASLVGATEKCGGIVNASPFSCCQKCSSLFYFQVVFTRNAGVVVTRR